MDDDVRAALAARRSLLGRRVRVTLSEQDQVIVTGQLLGFGDGGDIEILEDDGFVHYCWPALKMEEVNDGPEDTSKAGAGPAGPAGGPAAGDGREPGAPAEGGER